MCIFVERWHVCPVPHNQVPTPPDNNDPRGVNGWYHGMPLTPAELDRFNLNTNGLSGLTYVHHKVESKVRCAMWSSNVCDIAPHEMRYLLHDFACSDCTGSDRCILPRPYEEIQLPVVPRTDDQSKALDEVASIYFYWLVSMENLMVQAAHMTLPKYERMSQDHRSGMTLEMLLCMCCTEGDHFQLHQDGTPLFCEHCCLAKSPESHNLLRALLKREAETYWDVLGDDFCDDCDHLWDVGVFGSVFDCRKTESKLRHDWYVPSLTVEEHISLTNRSWAFLATVRRRLLEQGEEVEDHEYRGAPLKQDWPNTIQTRSLIAERFAGLIALDRGVSQAVFERLLPELGKILCPWPREDLPDDHQATSHDVEGYLQSFVRAMGMDGAWGYEVRWSQTRHPQYELILTLESNRDVMGRNAKLAAESIQQGLDKLQVLGPIQAREIGETCSVCLEQWLDITVVPKHMQILVMPCCRQVLHRVCIQALLRSMMKHPKCPLCRCSLREHHILGDTFREQLEPEMETPPGLLLPPIEALLDVEVEQDRVVEIRVDPTEDEEMRDEE